MMSLFTTPAAPSDPARGDPIREAIRNGAEKTGADFDYLLATAQRESALDPKAKASGSSATGLFQFIEQTWLGLVKSEGPKLGLGDQAATIATRPGGSHAIADPAQRDAILGLREDPGLASVLAGTLTQKNRDLLVGELGREPTRGELYAAHVLGGRGAADLIRSAQRTPGRAAALDFPDAAAANRPIFFDRGGRARGAAEVYGKLTDMQLANATGVVPEPATAAEQPLAFAGPERPGFHGLFRNGSGSGPVSGAVSRLWQGGAKPEALPAQRFFPRSDLEVPLDSAAAIPGLGEASAAFSAATSGVPAVPPEGEANPADPVPLPPRRPATRSMPVPKAPLDLGSFMQRRGA